MSVAVQSEGVLVQDVSVPDNSSVVNIALTAMTEFIRRTGISIHGLRCDPQGLLEKRVREVVKSWDLGGVSAKRFDAMLVTGVDIAASAYTHTPIDTQVQIALYTLLATCVDDFLMDSAALEQFSTRYITGSPQRHPLLQHFADNLSSMKTYFLPFAANTIVEGALAFVDCTVFDEESKNIMPVHESARRYIEWKRTKNGITEAFTLFIWDKHTFPSRHPYTQAIPEVMLYMGYANDILSFYKEEADGERDNYVHERARMTRKTAHEALLDVVNDTVAAVDRSRSILGENNAERAALENFLAGYAAFHVHSPRYRLLDLMKTQKACI